MADQLGLFGAPTPAGAPELADRLYFGLVLHEGGVHYRVHGRTSTGAWVIAVADRGGRDIQPRQWVTLPKEHPYLSALRGVRVEAACRSKS